ncbi:MAG TPA: hypothetical protein VEU29_05465 [Actinomycetota bacterium]|nr:hypothetical protein [Actinomycetota bacterium]
MQRRPRATWLWLVLLALGGLLSGHVVSYFVVAPDAHERADLLASTGHSGHGGFATIALAAVFAAVIGIFMERMRARWDRRGSDVARARVAALLWGVQTSGFVVLEAWERGHGVAGVAELLHEPAFLIGLVAQLVVALVAVAIVLLIGATVDALLRLFRGLATEGEAPQFPAASTPRPRASVAREAWNLRGPPSPARTPS